MKPLQLMRHGRRTVIAKRVNMLHIDVGRETEAVDFNCLFPSFSAFEDNVIKLEQSNLS